MKILHASYVDEGVTHTLVYDRDLPGSSFGFPCDEAGLVEVGQLAPAAYENFVYCQLGKFPDGETVSSPHVENAEYFYRNPAVGECVVCARPVMLATHTNTCECGADYNQAGQHLAPREQWGEETGERWFDMFLGVDNE